MSKADEEDNGREDCDGARLSRTPGLGRGKSSYTRNLGECEAARPLCYSTDYLPPVSSLLTHSVAPAPPIGSLTILSIYEHPQPSPPISP